MSSLELLIVIPSRWSIALMVFSTATAVIRMLPGILSISASVIVIIAVIVVVASLVAAAALTAAFSDLISRVAAALTHRVVVERERLEWAA